MSRATLRTEGGRVAIAAAICLAVVVAGCSESNRADDERDRRDTTADEQATEQDSARQEVVDAYLAAGEAFNQAAAGPDPDYPLEETHTGPMLAQSRQVLDGLASDGLVIEYPEDSEASETVTDVRIDGDVAYLEVCAVDDGRRVNRETGEVVAGGGVSTVWSTAAMRRETGRWKLAELRQDDRQDGAAECSGG